MESRTSSPGWVKITRKRLFPLLVGCLYHPKSTIITTRLSSEHKSAKIILCRYLTHLDMSIVCEAFKTQKLIHFATRHDAHLDNIYSNLPEYTKQSPKKLRPLVGNKQDHCCVFVPTGYVKARQYTYKEKCVYQRDTKAVSLRHSGIQTGSVFMTRQVWMTKQNSSDQWLHKL